MSKTFTEAWIAVRDAKPGTALHKRKWRLIEDAKQVLGDSVVLPGLTRLANANLLRDRHMTLGCIARAMYEEFPDLRVSDVPSLGCDPAIVDHLIDSAAAIYRRVTGRAGRLPLPDAHALAIAFAYEREIGPLYTPEEMLALADAEEVRRAA